jgi:queuine tRNA-ribosyltransferase
MERCLRAHAREDQALFGIVQGSTYEPLRRRCAEALVSMDLTGYAIGGVSVGEGHELLVRITGFTAPMLPEHKPRYLMGVGLPEDLVAAIGLGMDMFDCVIPTRYARSGVAFTARGRVRLTNRRYRRDGYPIDTSCDCTACAGGFTRAYVHHLFAANEILSAILVSVHNVRFYERLVQRARSAVLAGRYDDWRREFLAAYASDANDDQDGASSGGSTPRKRAKSSRS